MAVQSFLIEHDGSYAGHALSLGARFTFHTPRQDLSDLDDKYFVTVEDIQAAVNRILDEPADDRVAA